MGWLARVIVPSAAVVFMGCAAIANFGDTETTTGEQNPSSPGASSTSGMTSGMRDGTTSGSSADSGATSEDSSVTMTMEAGDSAMCPAPKRPIGEACNAPQDCCSGACANNHQCKTSCKIINAGCSPGSADCCLGEYCSVSNLSRCSACHADGTSPETISGVAIAASCCSNHLDAMGKCNP